jgi:hypothetical protein
MARGDSLFQKPIHKFFFTTEEKDFQCWSELEIQMYSYTLRLFNHWYYIPQWCVPPQQQLKTDYLNFSFSINRSIP